MEMLALDDVLYIRGLVGDSGKWLKPPGGDEDLFRAFSPEKLLAMLRSASRETGRIGEEDVRGESTVHYQLTVSCREAQLDSDTTPVDVWIDDDGLVRRIGFEDASGSGTLDFFDFGVEVEVEAPPVDQVAAARDQLPSRGCEARDGDPVRVERAIEVLGEHGFLVAKDGGCSGGIVVHLTNDVEPRGADFSEGYVACFVFARPESASTTFAGVDAGGSGGTLEEVERVVENLQCTLFVDGARAAEVRRRFTRALDEVERAIRP